MHATVAVERVRAVFRGETTDRPPLFDLLANDAIIEHFTGRRAEGPDAADVVYAAYVAGATECTRPKVAVPVKESARILPSGRKVVQQRWTEWVEPMPHADSDEALADLRDRVQRPLPDFEEIEARARSLEEQYRDLAARIAPCGLVMNPALKPGLMELYEYYGWEHFAYILAMDPGLVSAHLERTTEVSVRVIEALDVPDEAAAVITCCDIAGSHGPFFSPDFLRTCFLPRLARIAQAYRVKGVPFIFHSDGDLMPILDDLVACGIDGLNPIDVSAGMNAGEIRRRYPRLVLVGGIDNIRLLPGRTPREVRDATRAYMDTVGAPALVGSASEVGDDVPLENYLAMAEAVRGEHS